MPWGNVSTRSHRAGNGGVTAMTPIVPRWEWRSFGESFGSAESVLTAQAPERVHETDELYLLSPESDASVKVRDSLMDVKQLESINQDGLEHGDR